MASADEFMGGASDAATAWTDDGLRVTGTLRSGFAFPYAGAMWNAAEVPMQTTDRRGWTSLRLRTRGDIERLRVMFFSGNNPQPIWRDVDTGEAIEIPLAELPGLDLAAFQAVGVFAAEPMGEYDFIIEEAAFR
jgi:hypothetical protein